MSAQFMYDSYIHPNIHQCVQILLYPVRNAPGGLSLRMLAFIHTLNTVCTFVADAVVVVSVTFVFAFVRHRLPSMPLPRL